MYDVKIVGGALVDGTGAASRRADIGIKDGKIVAVGDAPDQATRTLDADGHTITPGFVDVHTHYDGQASWDADLAPSCFHGVTTAVMGSCGVGFAPVRPEHHDKLVELMEGVEDIPGSALAEGLTWEWETFSEYMDALDRVGHVMDVGCQVPHDVLRVYVMGERAFAGSDATDDDIAKMRAVIEDALDAGAVGLTTGRSDNHRSAVGDYTPASEATLAELTGIAKAFQGRNKGVLQAVSDFDHHLGSDKFDHEFDLIEAMHEATGGRPLSVSLMQRDAVPGQYKRILKRMEAIAAKGRTARVQVAPRPIGVILGFETTFHPFMGFPGYKEVHHLPLAERVKALQDPERRTRILSERSEPVAGDGSMLPKLADDLLAQVDMLSMRMFRLGDPPDYEPKFEDSLFAEAQRKGIKPLAAIYDALLEDAGKALLYFPLYNYTAMSLDAVREMLTHPLAIPGLSDGGAHVGTICDASFPSFLLSYWGRDRPKGRIPLETLVEMQTGRTAKHLGLDDRGVIAVGKKADVNVIDMSRLSLGRPTLTPDLPAGGKRLLQGASGYRYTLVSGQVVLENDALTGTRAGKVVRL